MEKITESIIQLIDLQSNTGIDALQIFDSWHSLCPPEKVWDWSLRWIREITRNAPTELPYHPLCKIIIGSIEDDKKIVKSAA